MNSFGKVCEEIRREVMRACIAGTETLSDAEDIFQETFVDLHRAMSRARPILFPRAYAMRIVRRKLSEYYRRPRPADPIGDGDGEPIEIPDDIDVEETVVTSELMAALGAKLREKPRDVQRIFYLYYAEEKTLSQIAEETGLSLPAVKNKLYRTLKELRELYGRHGSYRTGGSP